MCDSGYGYRGSIATVLEHQADVVLRICPRQFPLSSADGTPFDVLAWLRQRGANLRSRVLWCTHARKQYRVRLVVVKLPCEVARANRRRILQRWKQKGHKLNPTTFLAGYVVLVTTLEADEWDEAAVARLYRARWQIEVVFKRMKQMVSLGQVRSKDVVSGEATVRAVLIGWALQEGEAERVAQAVGAGRERRGQGRGGEVSSWRLNGLCVETLRQQVRGVWSQARAASVRVAPSSVSGAGQPQAGASRKQRSRLVGRAAGADVASTPPGSMRQLWAKVRAYAGTLWVCAGR